MHARKPAATPQSNKVSLRAIGEYFDLRYATASRIVRDGIWQSKM